MSLRRSDFSDPGCMMPDDSYSSSVFEGSSFEGSFSLLDDDEETVVINNRDKRPSIVGKREKIRRLSSISQEERDARDRQLITMYSRRKSPSASRRSNGGGGSRQRPPRSNRTEPSKPKSLPWSHGSNRSIMSQQTGVPDNFYPYYDLVVTDVVSAAGAGVGGGSRPNDEFDGVILPPTYSQSCVRRNSYTM